MDYERKYNEALEKARFLRQQAVAGGNPLMANRYEQIFLELAESDDDRIMKAIDKIMCLSEAWDIAEEFGLTAGEIRGYIAKQKEPKPGTTEDNPIEPFDTKLFQDGVKEGRRLEREDMLKGKQSEPFSCGHENGGNSEKPNNQWSEDVLPGIESPGIPGKDFIPVEWVDACEKYGKWKIVKQEQPDVDIRKELGRVELMGSNNASDMQHIAIHFYELGLNARKEE